jgi:hypothetical protein
MTMTVMKLLKEEIRRWEVDINRKLLVWAVATIAFHGAFRIHELLNKVEGEFDPDFALLGKDIKVKNEGNNRKKIEIKLKGPKENRSNKAVVVDILECGGTLCPVKAYTRWRDRAKPTDDLLAFRDENGVPLTGKTQMMKGSF